jgi:glycosyltransferase involved in cell wall biosynthesis
MKVTGGADRHCLDLADILRGRGHSVRFLATGGAGIDEAGGFVPLSVSSASRNSLSRREQLGVARRSFWNASAAAAMGRLLRDFKPDVVHAHKLYPQLSVAPIVRAHQAGVPVVQTAHDFEFVSASAEDDLRASVDRHESALRFRALNTATFPIRRHIHAPRVSAWITVSRFVASVYANGGIDCNVLENFTVATSESLPPFERRDGAVFIGRLMDHKGIEDVLELARRTPELSVTVAGFGPRATDVCAAADALPNLRYAGRVSEAEKWGLLRDTRVVLIPSRWAEPGPATPLEAMANGTPIVAFANGGLAEYVENAGAGVTVAEDREALVEVTQQVHDDRNWWNALSRAGVIAVNSIHSPDRYVERLEAIYRLAITRSDG